MTTGSDGTIELVASRVGLQGSTLLDRYRLIRRLGKGASGDVYLARDVVLDCDVAVKLLNASAIGDDEAWQRFRREILLSRQLAHPCICRTFDLHVEGDTPFITMEYLEGPTLEDVLEKESILPIPRAIHLSRSLCRGLRIAHRQGVVHRDLKPRNIIVMPPERPVILDFGFALSQGSASLTQPGYTLGTPSYMAPEVLRGETAGPAADVYAVAVILYRCLTGAFPHDAADAKALHAIAEGRTPISPRTFNSAISATLSQTILKGLAPTTTGRFESALAFEEALAEHAQTIETKVPDDISSAIRSLPRMAADDTVKINLGEETFSALIRQQIAPTTILFSDIVGITPYFDHFGDVRGRKLLEKHNEMLFPVINDHGGQVIKTIGDAIMASFTTADNGVAAAIEMQMVLQDFNATAPRDHTIRIRIGINSGQAIVEKGDVFGNAVNVAARIAAKANGDEILVASATREMLNAYMDRTRMHSDVSLKGKQGTFTLFAVDWRSDSQKSLPWSPEPTREAPLDLPRHAPRDTTVIPTAASRGTERATEVVRLTPMSNRGRLISAPWAVAGALVVVFGVFLAIIIRPHPPASGRAAADKAHVRRDDPPALPIPAPARMDPPPVDIEPVEPPERTPAPVKPSKRPPKENHGDPTDEMASRARDLAASVASNARVKGIIPGDVPELDAANNALTVAMRQKRFRDAIDNATRSQALIEKVTVDMGFAGAKTARFNRRFDTVGDATLNAQIKPILDAVTTALTNNSPGTANVLLNRAFSLLEKQGKK